MSSSNNSPSFKEEYGWEPVEVEATLSESPSRNDKRHLSSASISTLSTADNSDQSTSLGRGRRSRPSVASASSQLPTVREKKEQRALSLKAPSSLTNVNSEETVVSSKKVLHA